MKLCCFFNYAPLYRQSVYEAIDKEFDTQFLFGKEVGFKKNSGIAKLDYSIFKKEPIEFENKTILKHFLWRTKLIRQLFKGYDTFLVTGDLSFSYIPFIIGCKLLGKRVYGWGHGPKDKNGKSGPIFRWLLRRMTGFFTYSEEGKNRMCELCFDKNKVHVIYNSLSAPVGNYNFGSDIYHKHFKNKYPVIQFVGRLTASKKLDWLIKAHSQLNSSGFNCNLVIIGDGETKENLIQLSKNYGYIDRIWFYGECYDDEFNRELIYNADLCVSPGNVGLTAIHSLQYGTPVISHNNFYKQGPEYEVIVPYKTGLLYKEGDYENFYKVINDWFKFAQDRREEIRQNCYEMINGKWNSDNQIAILKKVLNGNAE